MNGTLIAFVSAVGIVAAFVLYRLVLRRGARTSSDKPDPAILTLTADDRAFTVTDSRKIKSLDIRWADVKEVTLIRTDKGPFDDSVFYHVVYDGGDITLPAGANNLEAFRKQLTELAGFDHKAHAAGLASAANNSFIRLFTA